MLVCCLGVLLGNDSLLVRDIVAPSNPRLAYNKRAGYANIDVLLIGKTLIPCHDETKEKVILPKVKWVRHVGHPLF